MYSCTTHNLLLHNSLLWIHSKIYESCNIHPQYNVGTYNVTILCLVQNISITHDRYTATLNGDMFITNTICLLNIYGKVCT